MNKAILRNSEIVIFNKKNNFAAALVGFFPTRWMGNRFSALQVVAGHWSLPTIWVSWSVKKDADFLK